MQRGALLQVFTREIDLPWGESFVETNLSYLQLFDTKEHEENLNFPGQNHPSIAPAHACSATYREFWGGAARADAVVVQDLRPIPQRVLVFPMQLEFRRADFGDLFRGQAEFQGADDAGGLLGGAHAYNGRGDGGIPQRPGDGDFSRGAAVARADLIHLFRQREVASQVGFQEGGG